MDPVFSIQVHDKADPDVNTHTVAFWYNTKTHKYHIVMDSKVEELVMSKAKAESVIKFLKWVKS